MSIRGGYVSSHAVVGIASSAIEWISTRGDAAICIVSPTRDLAIGVSSGQWIAASIPRINTPYTKSVSDFYRIRIGVILHCLNIAQLIRRSCWCAELVVCEANRLEARICRGQQVALRVVRVTGSLLECIFLAQLVAIAVVNARLGVVERVSLA